MTQLEKLETTLDDVLNKKAPFKIPEDGRKTLAGAMWWLSLLFGILQLWLVWHLWHLGHVADAWVDYANSISSVYGVAPTVHHLGLFYYLALITLGITGVLSLLAAPGLKAMKKAGWDLLFYALLVNAVYGVVAVFTSYGGFGNLIGALVGSVVGAYLLFQVRGQFMKSHVAEHKA